MGSTTSCCKEIDHNVNDQPAFGEITILGWYDGAACGIIVCSVCLTRFYFYLVDWNSDHSIRAFALRRLQVGTISVLSDLLGPRPPQHTWFPDKLIARFDEDISILENAIDELVAAADPPTLVMAMAVSDYVPICAQRIAESADTDIEYLLLLDTDRPPTDWMNVLGFAR